MIQKFGGVGRNLLTILIVYREVVATSENEALQLDIRAI